MHVLVEVLEQCAPGVFQPRTDLLLHFGLQGLEVGIDSSRRAAFLVDRQNALLRIHAGLDGAEHFVGGSEHTAK